MSEQRYLYRPNFPPEARAEQQCAGCRAALRRERGLMTCDTGGCPGNLPQVFGLARVEPSARYPHPLSQRRRVNGCRYQRRRPLTTGAHSP